MGRKPKWAKARAKFFTAITRGLAQGEDADRDRRRARRVGVEGVAGGGAHSGPNGYRAASADR